MANSTLIKVAYVHYEALADTHQEFTLADVTEAVRQDPALDSAADEVMAAAVEAAVRKVDESRTKESASEQQTIFGDSGQIVPLGGGHRIRRGTMKLIHTMAHLELVNENERQVVEAARRERDRCKALMPYLSAAPITWDEAVRRYEGEHGAKP